MLFLLVIQLLDMFCFSASMCIVGESVNYFDPDRNMSTAIRLFFLIKFNSDFCVHKKINSDNFDVLIACLTPQAG